MVRTVVCVGGFFHLGEIPPTRLYVLCKIFCEKNKCDIMYEKLQRLQTSLLIKNDLSRG